MAVGAAIVGGGLALGWKGVRAGFTKWFDIHGWLLWLLAPICQFGLVARGFVLLLIGVFLIAAGAGADAGVARGLVAALQWLQSQRPFGQWLYAAMAAGLTAFGIYSFVAAVFRELRGLDRYAD